MTLSWAFLAVSLASFAVQSGSLLRMLRGGLPRDEPVRGGLVRTAACRVLAAAAYIGLATASLVVPAEAAVLAVATFAAVQLMWISNSVADVALRRRLDHAPPRHRRTRGAAR